MHACAFRYFIKLGFLQDAHEIDWKLQILQRYFLQLFAFHDFPSSSASWTPSARQRQVADTSALKKKTFP